jgi:hypothetical protein
VRCAHACVEALALHLAAHALWANTHNLITIVRTRLRSKRGVAQWQASRRLLRGARVVAQSATLSLADRCAEAASRRHPIAVGTTLPFLATFGIRPWLCAFRWKWTARVSYFPVAGRSPYKYHTSCCRSPVCRLGGRFAGAAPEGRAARVVRIHCPRPQRHDDARSSTTYPGSLTGEYEVMVTEMRYWFAVAQATGRASCGRNENVVALHVRECVIDTALPR